MVCLMIAIILAIISIIWSLTRKYNKRKEEEKKIKERETLQAEYREYLNTFGAKFGLNNRMFARDYNDWLVMEKNRGDLSNRYIPNYTNADAEEPFGLTVIKVLAIILGTIGIIVIIVCNINNRCAYKLSQNRTEIYQELVDNAKEDRLAEGGYEEILKWNNTIITNRMEEEDWLFKWYHITDGDWNETPLVTFQQQE